MNEVIYWIVTIVFSVSWLAFLKFFPKIKAPWRLILLYACYITLVLIAVYLIFFKIRILGM